MLANEGRHMIVAAARALPAHHDGNDAAALVLNRGDEVEAGSANVAGLDAVHAFDASEHTVVGGDALLAVHERAGGEIIVILREVLAQRDTQDRHVARGRELLVVRQAMGVAELRRVHAELARLGGHHLGEGSLGAAEHLADRGGNVIGRTRHERADRRVHCNRSAGLDAQLGRLFGRRVPRHRNGRVRRDAL